MEDDIVRYGYLQHRPGGALGRWKKKRYWFVLHKNSCEMVLYKSQTEIDQPLVSVDIKDACITLLLENSFQFLISSDGKEHIITADSHQSRMEWLQSLQDVRDSFRRKSGGKSRVSVKAFSGRATATATPREGLASNGFTPQDSQMRRHTSDVALDKTDHANQVNTGNGVHNEVRASVSVPMNLSASAVADTPDAMLSPVSMNSLSSRISHSSTEDTTGSMGDLLNGPVSAESNGKESFVFDETTDHEDELDSRDGTTSEEDLEDMDKAYLIRKIIDLKEDLSVLRRKMKSLENREETYVQMLRKREQDIMNLDDKLGQLEQKKHVSRDMLSGEDFEAAQRKIRDLQDTNRMYQDQNAFLNQEVRKQAAFKCRAKAKVVNMEKKLTSVDSALVSSKREFLHFLRNLIEVSSLDHKDKIPFTLDWEDEKLSKFLEMFDEARKQDPNLPDARVLMAEGYTTVHGFRHCPHNQPLLFHHTCHLLDRHLVAFSKKQVEHRRKWDDYVKKYGENYVDHVDDLRNLVYEGIPPDKRSAVWTQLILNKVKQYTTDKGEDYYETLRAKAALSSAVDQHRRQIHLDLLRTMPQNIHFSSENSKGIAQLREVLEAFCVHNPNIGYCQGMNFIVGMSLLFMDSEKAFWCLVAVAEYYFPPNYFDASLIGAQADQSVLKDVLEIMLPDLHAHLDDVGVEMCSFTLNWFLAMFFEVVPFQTLQRIWDCFLLDGLTVLFQFSVALLKYHEKALLKRKDILAFLKDTKLLARLTFDIEKIVEIVKSNQETFPSWTWIQERQAHYMKILRKVYEEQERARKEFEKQEGLNQHNVKPSMRDLTGTEQDLLIDWATEFSPGKLLVCRSDVKQGWISRVDVQLRTKESLGVRMDSRVMCMTMAGENLMLVGTLSWYLYAYTINTREEVWCERLRDSPLCLEYDPLTQNVYIGLSDGTLAVIESVSTSHPNEVFYHAIGAAPVRSIVQIPHLEQIWCSCGNAVNILDSSLNIVNGFEVSRSPSIHISHMVLNTDGVWVIIRGSPVVTLWDPGLCLCILLYDTSTEEAAGWKRMSKDQSIHTPKVTSILPHMGLLWVGTSDGQLSTYQINTLSCDKPHVPSPMEERQDFLNHFSDIQDTEFSYSLEATKDIISDAMPASVPVSNVEDRQDASTSSTPIVGEPCQTLKQGDEKSQKDSDTDSKSEPPDSMDELNEKDSNLLRVKNSASRDSPDADVLDQMRKSQTLEGFVVVGTQETDTIHVEGEGKKSGQPECSDEESSKSPRRRKAKGTKRGSKGRLHSPKTLTRLLNHRGSKDKSTDSEGSIVEDLDKTPQNSPKIKAPRVLDKLSSRNSSKKRKYRYSQVMREAERRGVMGDGPPMEEIAGSSGEHEVDGESTQNGIRPRNIRTSVVSVDFSACDVEVCPHFELQLMRKCRISENHQVRALVLSRLQSGEPAIVSCSGYYGDDESLLRWTLHVRENVWMQVPIEETT